PPSSWHWVWPTHERGRPGPRPVQGADPPVASSGALLATRPDMQTRSAILVLALAVAGGCHRSTTSHSTTLQRRGFDASRFELVDAVVELTRASGWTGISINRRVGYESVVEREDHSQGWSTRQRWTFVVNKSEVALQGFTDVWGPRGWSG